MRNWSVIVAMGALLALPVCAQQKDTGSTANSNSSESTNAVPVAVFSIAHPSANLFGMPSAAAKPADVFSDWSNNPWNRHAWGQLTPKFEVAGMFSYINFAPGTSFRNFNQLGATASFAYNVNRWLGIVGEVGGYRYDRQGFRDTPNTQTLVPTTLSGNMQTYLFRSRLNCRRFDHFVTFCEGP